MDKPRFATLLQQAREQCMKQYNLVDMLPNPDLIVKFFASGMEYRMSHTHIEVERTFLSCSHPEVFLLGYLQGKKADEEMLQAIQEECKYTNNDSVIHIGIGLVQAFIQGLFYEESLLQSNELKASHSGNVTTWDAAKWLQEFETGKKHRDTHPARIKVWKDTLSVVGRGEYMIDKAMIVHPEFNLYILDESRIYQTELPAIKMTDRYEMPILVHEEDCLAFARKLRENDVSDDLCVLNLASYLNPGGGVINGDGAQEEYLFRCTDYYRSLYQYASGFDPMLYGIPKAKEHYPLDRNFGGCYSHGVTVFRDTEAKGYAYLAKPWKVNFVAAAVSRYRQPYLRIPDADIPMVINTIRTILRISHLNGQRRLVLGALGCGAFNNPPKHMAQLFKQVLEEPEFKCAFREIHFAIIDDHNASRKGTSNVKAFMEVFQ